MDLLSAVNRAAEDTDRLIRLAENLLLLAKADDPHALADRAPIRLDCLARQAGEAAHQRAATADVDLRLDLPIPATAMADYNQIRQVVDNLLDNALRFAPPGSAVTLRVTIAGAREPSHAVLEVSDHGPGFPAAFLPHAFERFRRADSGRSPHEGGTGLGLAIVASLVHAHGGTVTAGNRPDGGGPVRVTLPAPLQSRQRSPSPN